MKEVIRVETHFRINRILLHVIGLWPYQKSKLEQLHRILFYITLTSFIVFQLTAFLTTEWTPDMVIKILSTVLTFFGFVIKYTLFWIKYESVRYSLKQLQDVYNEVKDVNEVSIIERYGLDGKLYTIRLAMLAACSIIIVNSYTILPHITFVSRFLNHSRTQRMMLFTMEYFVDQEKYFYLILLHVNMAVFIGALVLAATGSILLTYMKHVCGMLTIASYRIDQVIGSDSVQSNIRKEFVMYSKLIHAVDIHRKAMMLATNMISNFDLMFFLLVSIGVLSLSTNFFRIFQILSSDKARDEGVSNFIMVCAVIIYILLANQIGQEVLDHNNYIFVTAYNSMWYEAPLKVQKMILFLLQRGNKTFYLTVGGLFQASLETAATLVSASISYFTVLCSTQ